MATFERRGPKSDPPAQNITDGFNSPDTQNCSYQYDDITRVTSANCGTAASQTFSYDPFGNINKFGSPNQFQPTYSLSTNRMTNISGFTPTYDSKGNVTNDSFHNYAWDADGHAITVDAGLSDAVNLTYDAFGRMVEQKRGSAFTQIVYSPTGEKLALMSSSSLQKAVVPLVANTQAIYNSSGLVYYAHSDFLGSIRLATTPTRGTYFDTAYAPFGETYASTGTLDPAYTGQTPDTAHRQDVAGGLYDFPVREYSIQGRWPNPDPAGMYATSTKNPQTQNRYAYVRNNPLSYTDPTGALIAPCDVFDPSCGAGGGGGGCEPGDPSCCDPCSDPSCPEPFPPGGCGPIGFPPIGGGFAPGGGSPAPQPFPWPELPLGFFAALEAATSSGIIAAGQADCDCTTTTLRPHKPSGIYGCTYHCECDNPKDPYNHKPLVFIAFSRLLVQHVKQYGRDCTYCPITAKGKFDYVIEQKRILFVFMLDLTLYVPTSLTYVSQTP